MSGSCFDLGSPGRKEQREYHSISPTRLSMKAKAGFQEATGIKNDQATIGIQTRDQSVGDQS